MAVQALPEHANKPKKMKSSKGIEGSVQEPEATVTEDRSKKKKKRKHAEDAGASNSAVAKNTNPSNSEEVAQDNNVPADDTSMRETKKKKRKTPESGPEELQLKKKKRDVITTEDEDHDTSRPPTAEEEPKKKKKKSQKVATEVKAKKKRQDQAAFSDPSEDSSLSDQASKALSYAYSQFSNPETWKFNKARQNWLIRNIWSEDTIPELYMPLVLQYLARVKGGVRDALIKSCQDIIQEASGPSPNTMEPKPGKKVVFEDQLAKEQATKANENEKREEGKPNLKGSRATSILECLSPS